MPLPTRPPLCGMILSPLFKMAATTATLVPCQRSFLLPFVLNSANPLSYKKTNTKYGSFSLKIRFMDFVCIYSYLFAYFAYILLSIHACLESKILFLLFVISTELLLSFLQYHRYSQLASCYVLPLINNNSIFIP